jgi:hypothetical protein
MGTAGLCLCVCMSIHVCVCTYVSLCGCQYISHVSVYACLHGFRCVFVCCHMSMYLCICFCMCLWVCVHICVSLGRCLRVSVSSICVFECIWVSWVSVFACVSMCLCICVCLCIYACFHVSLCLYVSVYLSACISVCLHLCVSVYVFTCLCVCVCICLCVPAYVSVSGCICVHVSVFICVHVSMSVYDCVISVLCVDMCVCWQVWNLKPNSRKLCRSIQWGRLSHINRCQKCHSLDRVQSFLDWVGWDREGQQQQPESSISGHCEVTWVDEPKVPSRGETRVPPGRLLLLGDPSSMEPWASRPETPTEMLKLRSAPPGLAPRPSLPLVRPEDPHLPRLPRGWQARPRRRWSGLWSPCT